MVCLTRVNLERRIFLARVCNVRRLIDGTRRAYYAYNIIKMKRKKNPNEKKNGRFTEIDFDDNILDVCNHIVHRARHS